MTNIVKNDLEPQLNIAESPLSESAVADAIVTLLDSRANQLHETQIAHLAKARLMAVNRMQHSSVLVQGGILQSAGAQVSHIFAKHRAMTALSGLALAMMMLVLVQQLNSYEHLQNGDAFLLASELPPEAFADKGFDTWLEAKANF